MTYTISKDFHFSGAHRLVGLADGHPCGRLHGHNWIVRATLTSDKLDEHGFVLDYGLLKPFSDWIDSRLDHKTILWREDVDTIAAVGLDATLVDYQPSAENFSRALASVLAASVKLPEHITAAVSVSETPKTWATWTR